jgi:hypothetical protein
VNPSLITVGFGSSFQLLNRGFCFAVVEEEEEETVAVAVGRGRRREKKRESTRG